MPAEIDDKLLIWSAGTLYMRMLFAIASKMKGLQTLFILLIIVSCNSDKKVCEFTSDTEELVIYNNILTDLIENRMHGRYLGGKEEEIREKYYYDKDEVDTSRIDREFIRAHNDIFNNPSKFCTLYLDTLSRPQFYYDKLDDNGEIIKEKTTWETLTIKELKTLRTLTHPLGWEPAEGVQI